jgi:putative phage-type endonuclease
LTREQWLRARNEGIGASDASAVVGCNPYKTNVALWEEKTGRCIPEDIGDKPYVKYGIDAEAPLRKLFALDYSEYRVSYRRYDIVRNKDYPYIFATLDGRLTERTTRRNGVLEIKTTEILRSMQRESWRDRIPQNYYTQVIHQLLATGWEFAVLKAQLKTNYDDEIRLNTRHYFFERSDPAIVEDIEFLKEKEMIFWKDYVVKDRKPNLILPNI